jgi:hypothetical protein
MLSLVVPMAMTSASCASLTSAPVSVTNGAEPCAAILKTVPAPQVKEGDDLRASVAQTRAALAKANHEIDAGSKCLADAGKK